MACKSYHEIPSGPIKLLRIYQYEKGAFPDLSLHVQWVPCYHCQKPLCVDACPTEAIFKEPKYGAVLFDDTKCDACRLCYDACPYGAPMFEEDAPMAKARKCDLCYDRLERQEPPICVLACPMRALDFGPLEALKKTYGSAENLEDLPEPGITQPSALFRSRRKKRQLIPYNAEKALSLFMRRDPLPAVFSTLSDVTDIPAGLVGRGELVLKHTSAEEMLHLTRNDEG